MNISLDGEEIRAEVSVTKSYRSWNNWGIEKWEDGSFSFDVPFAWVKVSFWRADKDDRDQPKYSRPKSLSLTIEHGRVQGYKQD